MDMEKRDRKAMTELRAALQPGACFEAKGGAFGKVLAREASGDGVTLTCQWASKAQVRVSKSDLRHTAAMVQRLVTAADHAAAVQLVQTVRVQKRPAKAAPATLTLREMAERIERLEAQVAELRQQPRNALQVVR
jgi:hypothetical protein